jgi:eukaryotic-like serine/threonine-protein kinase
MPLAAGTRLGPYEIVAPAGAGGMGEVYRARDTRLGRDVAIKVLPAHLAGDAGRRERFEREARAISALNHPHVCTLYDVGRQEIDGRTIDYLVMEHLEGDTLSDRLPRGPLPIDQVLRLGAEIADALDRAHRQGIVHRDLKPGNVMLTKAGAKVLDFGLARIGQDGPSAGTARAGSGGGRGGGGVPAGGSESILPTATRNLTTEGAIIGTLQYMAPEQLEGKEADARTDIFALGVTLYEMTTGRKAFEGGSQASLITSIMGRDPAPMTSVSPLSPPALEKIVHRCLAKDPDDRWQSARDLSQALRWVTEGVTAPASTKTSVSGAPAGTRAGSRERVAWALAAALGILAIYLIARPGRPDAGGLTREPLRASILPPQGTDFESSGWLAGPVVISPDGRSIAFVASPGESQQVLYVRHLGEPAARQLPGTEDARMPFWSPDGHFIGFFADRKLRRIAEDGGPVLTLCEAPDARGGTWNSDGVILFTGEATGPVMRIAAGGGPVSPATVLDAGAGEGTHRYPYFLPDGKHFLFLARKSGAGAGRAPAISVATLGSDKHTALVPVASNVNYASGYLVYVRQGALVAQAFDTESLTVKGEPLTLAADVRMDERFSRGVFSVSTNGRLIYQTGKLRTRDQLRWQDRSGKILANVGEPAEFFSGGHPDISPDGRLGSESVVNLENGISDVWLYDLANGERRRLTFGEADKFMPIWMRDGRRVAYRSSMLTEPGSAVVVKSIDASATEEVLIQSEGTIQPEDFSPDGRFFLYQWYGTEKAKYDLYLLPLSGEKKPVPFIVGPGLEGQGQFSPNGRFIAYVSDESGREEVYVTVFPGPGARWQVSQNGGVEPRWRRDGRELFYFNLQNQLTAAKVRTDGPEFQVAGQEALFSSRRFGYNNRYAVSADGQKFLVVNKLAESTAVPLTLVDGWVPQGVSK